MSTKFHRSGKLSGGVAVGLFLLSCLLALAALRWAFEERPRASDRERIAFSQGDAPTDVAIARIAGQLRIKAWHSLAGFPEELAQFETVFWEPRDTESLRAFLAESDRLSRARVLEVGTGTGLVALQCALHGARSVVATDINPMAVANARYNAELMGVGGRLEVRLVPAEMPGPFSVISAEEKFDLILSNPPWEDDAVSEVAAHALYDPGFELLDGLLSESARHLNPGGRLLLAYGARTAINHILQVAPTLGWTVRLHDERTLDSLPEVFLPGMLLELLPQKE